ncbi:hypothetical protein WBG78_30550 [Chryseolinea sp. T2]|uniref:hypothetical protein n=1 Tax=Chryseolinea sp. T2 TaxID=3129255 RepID=UPI003077F2BE
MEGSMIGSVQYSVLPPNLFVKENGTGWVLMNGAEIAGSALHQLAGIDKLPDARGVFLRSMNLGRDPASGDCEPDRSVGDYQGDMVGEHSHKSSHSNYHGTDKVEGGGAYPRVMLEERHFESTLGVEQPHAETRPRNISLYLYIKID